MGKGICAHTLIPVRKEPFESSEMVTQILFGETFSILETSLNWAYIEIHVDNYKGWIDKKLITFIEEDINATAVKISGKLICTAQKEENEGLVYILMGSEIRNCSDKIFYINKSKYELSYPLIDGKFPTQAETTVFSALQMLNIPYLWGGRSSFGIDCSGLVQTACKTAGIKMPRDASQQVLIGKTISSLHEAQQGDLAFFENPEGQIVHTGILISQTKIVHASGCVRTDGIDNKGIFNRDINGYTHKLNRIKRILNNYN